MVTLVPLLFVALAAPFAFGDKSDFSYLFGKPPSRAEGKDVSLSENPAGVNLGATMVAIAEANATWFPGHFEKHGNRKTLFEIGDHAVMYTLLLYQSPEDKGRKPFTAPAGENKDAIAWSATYGWPSQVASSLKAAGVSTFKNGVTLKSVPIKRCLQYLLGPAVDSATLVGTVLDFDKQVPKFTRSSGKVVVIETMEEAKDLKPQYAYALLEFQTDKIILSDPDKDGGEKAYRLPDVVGDFKVAYLSDASA